jgi:hypothetical protein
MSNRKKIKVKKLQLTAIQLQNARDKAYEEFKTLVVWKDSSGKKQITKS